MNILYMRFFALTHYWPHKIIYLLFKICMGMELFYSLTIIQVTEFIYLGVFQLTSLNLYSKVEPALCK